MKRLNKETFKLSVLFNDGAKSFELSLLDILENRELEYKDDAYTVKELYTEYDSELYLVE